MILSEEAPESEDFNDSKFLEIYEQAMDLYGLVHSRYILSPRGLAFMKEKYLLNGFGTCPRVLCKRQSVMPIGISEELNTSRVKVFCPKCQDVFVPRKGAIDIDGAYFGTSFPQALTQAYPEIVVAHGPEKYIPTIYGFRMFGAKGSRYERTFDDLGELTNEEFVEGILNKKKTDPFSK